MLAGRLVRILSQLHTLKLMFLLSCEDTLGIQFPPPKNDGYGYNLVLRFLRFYSSVCVQYNTQKWKRSHKATTNWIIVSPLLVKDAIACGAGGFFHYSLRM